MNVLELRIPPPAVALITALAMWAVERWGPATAEPSTFGKAAAAALALLGIAIDLAGLAAFRRARTTINPMKPGSSSSLVTGGIYRITRNPMYLGMLCLLLAWAAYLANHWALLGPVFFVAYITRFQIVPEERALRRLFGEDFERYATRVRRWL